MAKQYVHVGELVAGLVAEKAPIVRNGKPLVMKQIQIVSERKIGRSISLSTIRNWMTIGKESVVLPSEKIGGFRVTSAEALDWFLYCLPLRSNGER